jgi:hypothetical protein
MAYSVRKFKRSWNLVFDIREKGVRLQRVVPKTEWAVLGFKPDMTILEATAWAQSLSATERLKNAEKSRQKIQVRLKTEDLELSSRLPEPFASEFEKRLLLKAADQDTERVLHQWRATRRILVKVELPLEDWNEFPAVFYKLFTDRGFSADYVQRLLSMINKWGFFLAKKTGKPYLPIPVPRGRAKERITDSFYEKSDGNKSAPITPDELENSKDDFSPEQYNWLFVSIWFGLRPHEIDQLSNKKTWKVITQDGYKVLMIYQPKLISLKKEERWKLIPVLFPEQQKASALIEAGRFDRPLNQTIRKYIKPSAKTYGGRKGFVSLMRSKKRSIYEISAWLGHRSPDRTKKDYEETLKLIIES